MRAGGGSEASADLVEVPEARSMHDVDAAATPEIGDAAHGATANGPLIRRGGFYASNDDEALQRYDAESPTGHPTFQTPTSSPQMAEYRSVGSSEHEEHPIGAEPRSSLGGPMNARLFPSPEGASEGYLPDSLFHQIGCGQTSLLQDPPGTGRGSYSLPETGSSPHDLFHNFTQV